MYKLTIKYVNWSGTGIHTIERTSTQGFNREVVRGVADGTWHVWTNDGSWSAIFTRVYSITFEKIDETNNDEKVGD